MKELLLQYAQYNQWANKKMIAAMQKLADGDAGKEIISSFRSLKDTVYHTWSAEYIWLQRLLLVEHPIWIQPAFTGTFEAACEEWQDVSARLTDFTAKQYDEKAFTHECMYYDTQKMPHKTPVYQVLHHVFNHSTYHRGQMITMLRQLDIKEIPGTDFIGFVRKKR